jgi:hypothetical protein
MPILSTKDVFWQLTLDKGEVIPDTVGMEDDLAIKDCVYTPPELAKILDLSISAIYDRLEHGKFPGQMQTPEKRWLVPQYGLDAYRAARTPKPFRSTRSKKGKA